MLKLVIIADIIPDGFTGIAGLKVIGGRAAKTSGAPHVEAGNKFIPDRLPPVPYIPGIVAGLEGGPSQYDFRSNTHIEGIQAGHKSVYERKFLGITYGDFI